jgi:hypothetical protein
VIFENLQSGFFDGTSVSDIRPVYGNFNIPVVGWIIMDAAVSHQGTLMYYCNAFFDFINNSCGVGIPCSASIGVAQKVNDSTFNKLPNTDTIFAQVNDTNYLVYAPQLSHDGLELYFTRLLKSTFNTQVCMAVRSNVNDNFSAPQVIHQNNGFVPEGPTISADKMKLYYHQKDGSGLHKIYLRYRNSTVGLKNEIECNNISIFPTPMSDKITIDFKEQEIDFVVSLYSEEGALLNQYINEKIIGVSSFSAGVYILKVVTKNAVYTKKLVK